MPVHQGPTRGEMDYTVYHCDAFGYISYNEVVFQM